MALKRFDKYILSFEAAAVLALTAYIAVPYFFCGMGKSALFSNALVILGAWACVASGLILFFQLWRKASLSSKQKKALLLVSLLVGFAISGLAHQALLQKTNYVSVDIICGERSAETDGYEIWLSRNYTDNEMMNMTDLPVVKIINMEYEANNKAFWYHNKDGSNRGLLRLVFRGDQTQNLLFAESQWSGVVEIANHSTGEITKMDLSEMGSGFQLYQVLQGDLTPVWKTVVLILLYGIVFAMSLKLIILAGWALFKRKIAPPRWKILDTHLFAALAGALLPVAILLYFGANNYENVDLEPLLGCDIVIFLVFLFGALLVDYCFSPLAGYMACIITTSFLFCYGPFSDWLGEMSVSPFIKNGDLLLFGGGCSVLLLVFMLLHKKRRPVGAFFLFAGVFTGILFLYNAFSFSSILSRQAAMNTVQIKNNGDHYTVEQRSLNARPNVYWLHFDGMLGFSTFEKYYGDSQYPFQNAMEARGFAINKVAAFEGGFQTIRCLPALLNPDFYDAEYAAWKKRTETGSTQSFTNFYKDISVKTMMVMQTNNALFNAFHQVGYESIYFVPKLYAQYITFLADRRYEITDFLALSVADGNWENERKKQLARIADYQAGEFYHKFIRPVYSVLTSITAHDLADSRKLVFESIFQADGINTIMLQSLTHAMSQSQKPAVYFVPFFETHAPYSIDENGDGTGTSTVSPLNYPPQHVYTTKVMLNAIDTILRYDPDAVIVVQGDHGLHVTADKEFIDAFGENVVISDFRDHVISAIRVPEKYQNGEEEFAMANPLNITRYLINNFVGHNYTYLTQE